jgi:hypothetical protein
MSSGCPALEDQEHRLAHLGKTSITDAGLAYVKPLTGLVQLHLEQTKITDKGLAQLKGLTSLTYLNLYGCAITDAGWRNWPTPRALHNLPCIWQTKVTDEGVVSQAGPARSGHRQAAVDGELGSGSLQVNCSYMKRLSGALILTVLASVSAPRAKLPTHFSAGGPHRKRPGLYTPRLDGDRRKDGKLSARIQPRAGSVRPVSASLPKDRGSRSPYRQRSPGEPSLARRSDRRRAEARRARSWPASPESARPIRSARRPRHGPILSRCSTERSGRMGADHPESNHWWRADGVLLNETKAPI